MTNNVTPPLGQFILFETDEGQTKVECRFETETLWLTQNLIAELYQKSVPTINEHLSNIYSEGELEQNATIRNFRIVRKEGTREVARDVAHYNLEAILAVGYRVRSRQGTQFRQWATRTLHLEVNSKLTDFLSSCACSSTINLSTTNRITSRSR